MVEVTGSDPESIGLQSDYSRTGNMSDGLDWTEDSWVEMSSVIVVQDLLVSVRIFSVMDHLFPFANHLIIHKAPGYDSIVYNGVRL